MTFDIRFDTRFDSTGFFADPDALAALDAAGRIWGGILGDDLEAVPAGMAFDIEDPSRLGTTRRIVLEAPIDDLLVFVGAQALDDGTLALGGVDGVALGGQSLGTAYEARIAADFRGQGPVTDFEPWAGGITFDTRTRWSFDPAGPGAGEVDFLTIALHEIGHVLGFGIAPIFTEIARGGFDGPNARRANDGAPIPLQADLGHVVEGFAGDSVLMDPLTDAGARVLPSGIDMAMLADIGWEIAGYETQGRTPPLATAGADLIVGTLLGDTLDGGAGADTLEGRAGDDLYRLDARGDVVIERAGEGRDTILAGVDVRLGDAEVEAVLLTGSSGARVTGNAAATVIMGGRGDDVLIGGGGGDVLTGGRGADVFAFRAGDLGGPAARIADFATGDRIALDDRLFGPGDGSVAPRAVTRDQVAEALRAGQAAYDGQGGLLSVRDGADLRPLVRIEGGGAPTVEDLLLF